MATTEELVIKLTADNNDLKKKLSESNKSVTDFSSHISKMGGLIAASFTGAAIGAFARQAFLASEEQEKANRRLLASLQGNTKAFEELVKQANKLQSTTGVADDAIMQIQQLGASAGKSTDEIKKITEASVQLAAKTGQDLQSAYMMLNGTLTGAVGRLGRVDKDFEALTETQLKNGEAIDLILKKYKGFAESSVSDLELMQANWGEFIELVGGGLSKVVNPLLREATNLIRGFNETQGIDKLMFVLNPAAARAQTAAMKDINRQIDARKQSMLESMPLYKQTQDNEIALKRATEELNKIKQGTADYLENENELRKNNTNNLKENKSALDSYISSMEEAYRKQSELAQFDVPVPTNGAMNAGVTLMTPKGITGKGGDASKLAARNQNELATAIKGTNEALQDQVDAIMSVSNAFIQMAIEGRISIKGLMMETLSSIRRIIQAKLAEAIASQIASGSSKGLPGLVLAGIGISGVMALFSKLPTFTNGGIAGGTSFSGDRVMARVNSGEMILNGNQQRELWAMANGYGQKQQIEVVGYISGDVIRLANKKSEYINGRKA